MAVPACCASCASWAIARALPPFAAISSAWRRAAAVAAPRGFAPGEATGDAITEGAAPDAEEGGGAGKLPAAGVTIASAGFAATVSLLDFCEPNGSFSEESISGESRYAG